MSALESNLTAFLLKATLLLVAVLAAHLVLRRSSAATRHLVLTLAFFGLVALPVLALSLPVWQLEVLPQATARAAFAASVPMEVEDDLAAGAIQGNSNAAITSTPVEQLPSAGSAAPFTRWDWSRALYGVWVLGAALVLARLLGGLLRLRGTVRNAEEVTDPALLQPLDECREALGLAVRPRLVSSDRVEVPLVLGWLRPLMVVPTEFTDWSDDRVRAVMLHELGHLKRNDWPLLVLGRVVAALYWFHPLVWYLERCARRECERACDDLVVTCGTRPSDYADHLLSIARGVVSRPAGMVAALAVVRRSQLKSRLRSILDPLLRRNAPSRSAVAGLSTALLFVLLPVASLQFAAQAHAEETQTPEGALLAQHLEKSKQHADPLHAAETSEGARYSEKAYQLYKLGRYAEAIELFEQALAEGYRPAPTTYNIACCHALLSDVGATMDWMERAIEAGFDDPVHLVKDSDFDPIRSDARFQEFIDGAFGTAGVERSYPQHYPYRAALEQFDEWRTSPPAKGKSWTKLGNRMLGFGELDRAIEAYRYAVEQSQGNDVTALYNLACAHSRAGSKKAALDWLERSVDAGFDSQERFENDTDLDNLRGSPEFDRIAAKHEFLSLKRFPRRHGESTDYSADRWAPAVTEYGEFVRENPSHGRGWFNYGYALHGSRKFDEAIEAFGRAAGLGYHEQTALFNAACGNALLGRTDTALDLLESLAGSGGLHYGQLESDTDLDGLRDEPRFEALLQQLELEKQEKHEYELKLKQQYKQQQQMKLQKKMKDYQGSS